MKKALKIIGIILLVIVVITAGLVIWKWPYISAVIDGMTKTAEQLGEMRVEDTEKTLQAVNKYMESDIRDLTDEEKEKIKAGELSQTEVLAQIVAEATGIGLVEEPNETVTGTPDDQQPVQEQTGAKPAPEQKPAVSNYDQLVAGCVNKLYGLQSEYTGQLEGLVARTKSYYSQQKSSAGEAAAKTSTANMVQGEVASMEGACDTKVEAVLSDLNSNLKAIGADTAIVGELRAAYEREKAAQRRAYVNRYMK